MDGNAFLFRIPNAATRNRVLSQGLWQIEGQTMFVAKWEPGLIPKKPELSSAPVWLELRNVPHQFFNEDGFEFIAGLVGDPKGLHPSTANLTNLEVAKVLTMIDPRKPLPEAVNVQFDSGEICRVLVSSPWMPPICSFCKEVGHSLRKCKKSPITCTRCSSLTHLTEVCPRANPKKKQKLGQSKKNDDSYGVEKALTQLGNNAPPIPATNKGKSIDDFVDLVVEKANWHPHLAIINTKEKAEAEATSDWIQVKSKAEKKLAAKLGASSSTSSHKVLSVDIGLERIQENQIRLEENSLASDSSDVQSDESDIVEARFLNMFSHRQQRNARGKGPKPS
ncbi:hypothetical protein V5N11_026061 [Cardamine amara subsp. amara]|uniref:DUF4283 domain-containing protein n=1 Tax=Cardamine amara subsp. amara TaxID=228776 RepID=A0ABD1C7V2_CARAN